MGKIQVVMTKIGCRYSQDKRYQEGYYDCSSLVQRLYKEAGIDLPATAAVPGDLIFYSMRKTESSVISPMWQFMWKWLRK